MTNLPRHLAPWAPKLALFSEDIALVLGSMSAHLSALIGSLAVDQATEGALDGYDGIARRGTYDRLLLTEWLFLDEMPDEFMRRAASGEHAFLQRAYKQDAASKRSIALFDAGPLQLGAPRIVHLAALLVLSQRAELRRARFEWGILQEQPGSLRESVNQASILDLLEGRSARASSRADVDQWMTSEGMSGASEVWLIGAETLSALATERRASTVIVSDVLDPTAPARVRVAVTPPRAARAREATLDLPPGNIAVRLLRDPFQAIVAPRQIGGAVVARSSNILFSADRRRIHLRGVNRALISIHVPNSPRAVPALPVVFTPPEGHVIVAVGRPRQHRNTIVLTQHPNGITLHRLSRRGAAANLTTPYAEVGPPIAKVSEDAPLLFLRAVSADHFTFIDADENLVELNEGRIMIKERASAAGSGDKEDTLMSGKIPRGSQSLHGNVPRGYEVCSAVERSNADSFLIALSAERTRLERFQGDGSKTVVTTTSPIRAVTASPAGPEIAFLTEGGELGVYSYMLDAILLRVTLATEGAP